MGRPLIAVTTSEMRTAALDAPLAHADPPRREMALGLRYLESVERAGGLPVVVPPLDRGAIGAFLDRVDGICLSGGPDLHPIAYDAAEDPALGPTEIALDQFELALAREADARGLPVLAICRGMQLVNVARGGTLHQHLPDVVGVDVVHRQPEPADEPTHRVRISRSSRLGGLAGTARLDVNSFHHQAVDRLGRDLVATAWASDGTIEGVEATDRAFCVGVQWHAECLSKRPQEAALFGGFIAACAGALPAAQTSAG